MAALIYTCMMTQLSNYSSEPCSGRPNDGFGSLLEPRFFRALCDPSRVALLARLAQCCEPCTVSQLAACCPTDVSVVSRHLAMLRDAGILHAKRRGKEVYYSVRYPELIATLRSLADAFEACCGGKPAEPVPATEPDAQTNSESVAQAPGDSVTRK